MILIVQSFVRHMSSASNWSPPGISLRTDALFDDAEPPANRLRLGVVSGVLPVVLTPIGQDDFRSGWMLR